VITRLFRLYDPTFPTDGVGWREWW